MSEIPKIHTGRTLLTILKKDRAGLVLQYYSKNREHLSPWDPLRDQNFYTLPYWEKFLEKNLQEFHQGLALRFFALNPDETEMIGSCNFSNIVRGVFQACHLGFSIGKNHQGKGLMFEIAQAGIRHAFEEFGLHRIMANYIPSNHRSEKLLKPPGFEREGYARDYLKIAGKWQDHMLTALINPGGQERGRKLP